MRAQLRTLTFSLAAGLFIGASALAAPAAGAAPAVSSPAAWSAPVRVIGGVVHGMAEVVDSHGHVIVAASGHGGVWVMTDRSGSWTQTRVLKDLTNRSYEDVSVALDANDRIYVAGQRASCNDCVPGSSDGIFLVTDKGHAPGTFGAPSRIAPQGSGEPTLKINGGHVFLAYVRFCCMPGPMPSVYLRTNASGSWTTSRITRHGDGPFLRIGSDGLARVAFRLPNSIGYAVAHTVTDAFSVWSVPGTNGGDHLGGFALDSHDQPHLVWTENVVTAGSRPSVNPNDSAIYDWRTTAGWHAPEFVGPLGNANSDVALDLDSNGHARIAAGGSSVKSFVRNLGHWTERAVAGHTDVGFLSIRRGLGGQAAIAWSNFDSGVWVSTGN